MRRNRINFLSDFFKFKTLQQRLIFIVVIETTASLLLLVLVSYQTIHSIEKNKLKTSMVSDLQQLTEKMTQNYMNMIQLSQQMSPEGTVGSLLDSYFQASSKYDVYQIGQQISDNLVKITFSSTEDFDVGKLFQLKDEKEVGNSYFGKSGKYVGVRLTADTGFINVLLLPITDYNREFYTWIRNVIGILFLAIFLFGFSFIVLSRLIYTPLSLFSKEMKKLGKGDLNAVYVHTGAIEYDELFKQFNTMKKQIQTLLLDSENIAHEKYQLEIEKIYYQINPHLMNTLHSINWLAKMHNQTEIEIFTMELNYILAYSLGKSDKQATIRTEVKMLQSYLRLQKMRYDFQAEVEVEDGDYLDTPTARMILQPIAENAIRHGLGESGGLWIRVSQLPMSNDILITIEDNGKGLTKEELVKLQQPFKKNPGDISKTDGIGLRYVRSILESFYGDKAMISITSELTLGTKVTLLLPINRE